MIYIFGISNRKRAMTRSKGRNKSSAEWYYEEAPDAKVIVVQRPFHYLSRGCPVVYDADSTKAYKTWLFKKLLTSKTAKTEFTNMLDALIQEGEIILQCSCIPPTPCHASVIKDALKWAEPWGIEEWHNQLKKFASDKLSKRKQ